MKSIIKFILLSIAAYYLMLSFMLSAFGYHEFPMSIILPCGGFLGLWLLSLLYDIITRNYKDKRTAREAVMSALPMVFAAVSAAVAVMILIILSHGNSIIFIPIVLTGLALFAALFILCAYKDFRKGSSADKE